MTVQTMQISIEQLVETIVRQVIAELGKRGVEVGPPAPPQRSTPAPQGSTPAPHPGGGTSLEIDMSAYRTPVLTEGHLSRLDPKVSTIIVPCNTVVTPGAWGTLRSKRLTLVRKTQSKR
jgi:hypothetical protein